MTPVGSYHSQDSNRTTHPGSCHCGGVSLTFHATRPLADLPLGRCDCSFCRRHGARTVADPGGDLVIRAQAGALNRYRFGLGITDMLLCATCGVYVAALITHEGRDYATLNANMLDTRDSLDPAPPLSSYGGETAEVRIARRLAKWTPARVEIVDG
jgi:hypothetical protein